MAAQKARIFISYKRNCAPDEPVALEISKALSASHDVFIDQLILTGEPWAKRIEEELGRTDFLVCLLSKDSVGSEMVLAEIETANRLSKENAAKPKILPVRLNYAEPFKYPLSAYLNPI